MMPWRPFVGAHAAFFPAIPLSSAGGADSRRAGMAGLVCRGLGGARLGRLLTGESGVGNSTALRLV